MFVSRSLLTLTEPACSIIGSRLDYNNFLLVGRSMLNLMKLQRVQNTLACIIVHQGKLDTPVLKD